MKTNIGDRVRFLNDVGEGIVTKINKNIAYVLIEDGFELPMSENELVVIKSEVQNNVKAEIPIIEKQIIEERYIAETYEEIDGNDKPNIYLAFISANPDDVLHSEVSLYLINDCNYILSYVISLNADDIHKHFCNGTIEPNTKILLKKLFFNDLNNIEYFLMQFILYKNNEFEPVSPINHVWKLNHKKFTKDGCFEINDFFDEKAMIYCVTDDLEEKILNLSSDLISSVIKEKQLSEVYQKQLGEKFKARPEPIISEVDLHINNLLSDCRGMSNHEILEYQMKQFHTKMNEAINSNISKIVFIHGIGNGTLKNEVRNTLTNDYPKYKYQDASFKEYGFGATMVILKS